MKLRRLAVDILCRISPIGEIPPFALAESLYFQSVVVEPGLRSQGVGVSHKRSRDAENPDGNGWQIDLLGSASKTDS
jgi:hypothetical protein